MPIFRNYLFKPQLCHWPEQADEEVSLTQASKTIFMTVHKIFCKNFRLDPMYGYIFCRHTLMRDFVSLCLFLRHSVFWPRQPLPSLLKDTGRERTDGNKDNCLLWTLREMHNAYKVSSKVNGKTINLLYLHCVHRLWAAFGNGAWWLQGVRRHIFPHLTEAEVFVLPKVTHTNGAGTGAGYFKFFGHLMVTRSLLTCSTASP